MKIITIKTDDSKHYYFASQALADKGYKEIGKVKYNRKFRTISTDLYEKDGKLYAFREMYHYNTTVYSIKLGLVHTLKGEYEIVEDTTSSEIR
ncbi:MULTISPECIES: hypothetical protein [Paenibacillus]|uniref:Uncharacterized protein n=1 Tax=Paenibacillus xylanilyticus TaxID=248903 RepID=A0A7Y6ETY9_9BACL|nr:MULTISPECIES: hypothetical protein [Paenibacillus]NUU75071.1 hypothetical protein [Paenibacillus xylanilyticus]PAF31692.1 hypothetical protein CHI14_11155 [Paenibacillus sp. 7516]